FPVEGELLLKARRNPGFPSRTTFERLGSKHERAMKVIAYCAKHESYDDVISICRQVPLPAEKPIGNESFHEPTFGFVYLLRSGRYFRIGRTNAAGRRERELAIQLPEKSETVHVIQTDDPIGIEAYWHKRFEGKRKNGEWFELDGSDLKAFKRR